MAALIAVGVGLAAAPAEACWEEFPRAERAFREGIEAFQDGEYSLAIERFRESRDARREPDPSCTVQLYGRGPQSKAYYLPYYYLARSFYLGREQLLESEMSCPDALHYRTQSLDRRGQTYDVYRRRFRSHLADLDDLSSVCDVNSPEGTLAATALSGYNAVTEDSETSDVLATLVVGRNSGGAQGDAMQPSGASR